MTSAEVRGNALADWLLDNGRVPIITHATRAKIIEAIRQAENDKLEEAAAATAGAALRAIDDGSPRRQVAVAVANAARSLKSKD